jgi:hypothetical protein
VSNSKDPKKFDPIEEALKLFAKARVFRDANKVVYVYTATGDTLAIHGEEFESDLKARFYRTHDRMLPDREFNIVKGILSARACGNPVEEVYIRLVERNHIIHFDLANASHEVVMASATGWKVSQDARTPFRRPNGMLALSTPQRGWEGWTVRDYLAYAFPRFSESALLAIAGFLIGALRPGGPFPLLQFVGGKGTLKSTTARMIKALIDPSVGDERGFPRNEQDFSIHARNCWIPLFGNISSMPRWLSDAFCRLSTGGAFGTRKLYTNDEESIITLKRPAIMTGISDPVDQSDLKDRILFVELPAVDECDRKTEEEVWANFRELQPYVLATVLDCICTGLASLDSVKPERLHRLADWHKFMIAAFPAMGFEDGLLDQMLEDNRRNAAEAVLESSWAAQAVIVLMSSRTEVDVTATELYDALQQVARDRLFFDPRCWPANPKVLSSELRRLESDLRHRGIRIEFPRTGKRRGIMIRRNACDADDAVKTSASPSAS